MSTLYWAFVARFPTYPRLLIVLALAGYLLGQPAPVRAATFLFDATKAESAGNANWVLDEDSNVAGRYPTPAAAGITASTVETYWTGALSSWGVALVQLGHSVEQLPVGGRITYQDSSNAQDLSRYQVYVVCEPNILFTATEKNAMARYVQDGGSLFVISDHAGSDRNNDGYDSVAIWNDFFANNGVVANPFGVTVNSVSTSLTSTYVDTAADDPLSNGILGAATQLKYSSGATLTINTTANPTVRAAFWSTSAHTNSTVMAAYGSFGAGRFAVMGDSSPPDDGTGSPGHTLYFGWTDVAGNHSRLILNASLWLATASNGVPYNDNFANGARLGPGATYATGTNIGATREAGEPLHADNAGGASVWWQFTAANSGTATITTVGSSFDTLLAVYTGSAVGALTRIAANDNLSASVLQSSVSLPVSAGTTYRVAVDGANGATGQVRLNLSLPGPANDVFANATGINYTGTAVTLTGNNYNATFETNEPAHANDTGGRSVWWRWTATASGAVTISTEGSDFDTSLAVYSGTTVGALTTVSSNGNYGTSLQSLLSFNAVAGTTYRIAVDGNTGAMGNITLALSPGSATSAPANDAFANATPINGTSITMPSVATTYATKETGEPYHGGNSGGRSIWYRWTPPGDGSVTVTTVGSNFDTTLGVYTGQVVNGLRTLALNDDANGTTTSKIVMYVSGDTTYSIGVDGYNGATGIAVVNLSFVGAPTTPPANDNFASAFAFSGNVAQQSGTYNTYATTEPNEPTPIPAGGHTLWWSWFAPSAAVVQFDTTGSSFTPALEVFSGTAINALKPLVATEATGALSFNAQAGVTYYGRTSSGSSGQTGYITFTFSPATAPNASLATSSPVIAEKGQTGGTLTVTLDFVSTLGVTIPIKLSGTATPNVDYVTNPPTVDGTAYVTIAAGATSGTLSINALADNDPTEGDETIIATSQAGAGYIVNFTAASRTVTIRDDSPYTAAWASTYRPLGFAGPSAAPTADPDGDGVPNLLEFAFNLNPLAADPPGALPVVGTGMYVDPADASGTARRYATLTFVRRTDSPNVSYAVETTSDPATAPWATGGAVLVSTSTEGTAANTERAVYRTTLPLDGPSAPARQILRVRVSVATP